MKFYSMASDYAQALSSHLTNTESTENEIWGLTANFSPLMREKSKHMHMSYFMWVSKGRYIFEFHLEMVK